MARGDEVLDILIMSLQPGFNLGLVDVGCALLLAGKEEVEVRAEAEPSEERHELEDW